MKLQYFIDRPILSMVISVVILVAGLIGLFALSVEQYPDIAPPTIRVSATYSGANAEAVQKSVVVPLEEAINGVENMTYMTSTASNTGSAEITVYFKQGSDADMAAVNVQNLVSTATSLLPAEVTKIGVTTRKRQNSQLKVFGLFSPNGTYDETFLTNYLNINIKPGIQRITGVGAVNGCPGSTCMINQISGTNANEIIINIDKYLEEVKASLPDDMELVELMSTKTFLDASINEVIKTLLEAIVLVVLVVYVFLQNPRSTLIPTVSIFVSLIGTFAALYAAGFSINLLTLFALVLAIGTIVDDAIIVVEAVQVRFDEGERSPYRASVDAMSGIASAIVTSTLVFMAVFVPVSFMNGTSGVFYTQFGITMAVAVGISAINALTLSPALCALILRPNQIVKEGEKLEFSTRFRLAFDSAFKRLVLKYKVGVKFFLKRKWAAWASLCVACVLLCYLMSTSRSGLVPSEDTGSIFISFDAPDGSTLAESASIMGEIQDELKQIEQIESFNMVAGFSMGTSGASHGMFIVKLKHWDERPGKENSVDAVREEIYRRTVHIKNATLFVFAPPMIMGYGSGNNFEMYMQDRAGKGMEALSEVTNNFLAELNKRPEIQMSYTQFSPNFPQYRVDVDEAQCQRAGVTTSNVLAVLSGYYGSIYASNFNRFTKIYRVILQAASDDRKSMQSLDNIFVKTANGMAPVSQFVTLTKTYGAESLERFNMFSSIKVQGMPTTGYSSGDVIKAIGEVAAQTLPTGYGYEFGGMTREEVQMADSHTTVIIYAVCILFIYLILCALYESLFVSMAVILSVPFGLLGSFLFARIWGLENNIYLQTGLIMLIGLLSKTAILMTEYATERRKAGMSLTMSAIVAAGIRLRPILMTALTMIFGLLPLMFASGVGANGNSTLGVGAVGGMFVGTVALLFVTPAFFITFQWIEERVMGKRKKERENA